MPHRKNRWAMIICNKEHPDHNTWIPNNGHACISVCLNFTSINQRQIIFLWNISNITLIKCESIFWSVKQSQGYGLDCLCENYIVISNPQNTEVDVSLTCLFRWMKQDEKYKFTVLQIPFALLISAIHKLMQIFMQIFIWLLMKSEQLRMIAVFFNLLLC